MPKSSIKSIAYFREIVLEMLLRYSAVRTRKDRFCISNHSMCPRKKFHTIFWISKYNSILHHSQLFCCCLVTSPSVCSDLICKRYYFIIWYTQPSLNGIDCFCRSIICHKSMGKTWMFTPFFVPQGGDCNKYQFLRFCSSPPFTCRCRAKKRIIAISCQ